MGPGPQHTDLRVCVDESDLALQAFGTAFVVGVHAGDQVASCVQEPGVQRMGDARAGFVQEPDAWVA